MRLKRNSGEGGMGHYSAAWGTTQRHEALLSGMGHYSAAYISLPLRWRRLHRGIHNQCPWTLLRCYRYNHYNQRIN